MTLILDFKKACRDNNIEKLNNILNLAKNNIKLLNTILTDDNAVGCRSACEYGHIEVVNKILDEVKDNIELLEVILTAENAFVFRKACYKDHTAIVNKILNITKDNAKLLRTILTLNNIVDFIEVCNHGHTETLVAEDKPELLKTIFTIDDTGFRTACYPFAFKQSIYLASVFYKYISDKDKKNFLSACDKNAQDIINICFNKLNWREISSSPQIIFHNINKLKKFDNILDNQEMMMIIRNARKGNHMKLLFSHNTLLSWAIDHLDESIDNKAIRDDLHKVINPWLYHNNWQPNNNAADLQENFQAKTYLILRYLIQVIKSPTLCFRIKNWFLQILVSIGLINKNNILKSDQEYFEILLEKYKNTFNKDNVTDLNNKIKELKNLYVSRSSVTSLQFF